MIKIEDWTANNATMQQHNTARYYDYLLGGFHNFAVDRKVGDMVIQICPDVRLGALANRAFLRRAVKFLCQQGIDQFLDMGSGIPTSGNVHEVAQAINPAARVFYVDNDPVAVIHSQAILKDNPNAACLQEDIHNIEKILEHPAFTALIDLKRPVGALMVAVLHFIKTDADVHQLLSVLQDRLAKGSYIVISHYSEQGVPAETIAQINRLAGGANSQWASRTCVETSRLFDGFDLVSPGVVNTPLWRSESLEDLLVDQPARAMAFAGVGRKSR